MLRPLLGTWERNLERTLLRKGVGRLREGAARCADCGRAPLIGELVHRFGREELVCDLCRPRRRTRPVRAERIQHAEHGLTVRQSPARPDAGRPLVRARGAAPAAPAD